MTTVGIVNLGCARNLVDAQYILNRIQAKGFVVQNAVNADVVIINTCCFVEAARRESVDVILDILDLKQAGRIRRVILAGCLVERYGTALLQELPGVDALAGVYRLDSHAAVCQLTLTPAHYAYVKICEGCCNQCSYCAIPRIKGSLVSRSMDSILEEIAVLDQRGVKEVNLIGQDITAYGQDMHGRLMLSDLLKKIVSGLRNIRWVRLLYLYPAHITDELLEVIAGEERICKYVDLPLQHINDRILRAMNRPFDAAAIKALLAKIRRRISGVALRSTFIVGFPGETETEFRELLDFIKTMRFERLGALTYSREEGTPAYRLRPQISPRVKKQRYDRLMRAQQEISRFLQERFVGQRLKVLVDERPDSGENIYLGRTQYDAPEVDGQVFISSEAPLQTGDFADVLINDGTEYDLNGTTA